MVKLIDATTARRLSSECAQAIAAKKYADAQEAIAAGIRQAVELGYNDVTAHKMYVDVSDWLISLGYKVEVHKDGVRISW